MLVNFSHRTSHNQSYEILTGLTYFNPNDGYQRAFITLDARQSNDQYSHTRTYHYGQSLADWQTGRSVDTQAIGNTVATIQRYIDYYIQPFRVPSFFTDMAGISPQSLFEQLNAAIELFNFIHSHEDILATSINQYDENFLNIEFGNDFDHKLEAITGRLSNNNKQTLHYHHFPNGWLLNCFLDASASLNPEQYNGSQLNKMCPCFKKSNYKDTYEDLSQHDWRPQWLPRLSSGLSH